MSSTNTSPIVYNQTLKDTETLKKEFVLRTKQFDTIFNDIKSSKMEHAEQQYLILGQRGSGKTTLLHRLKIAINEDENLNKWLIPIIFNEEQYNITELYDLWQETAAYLENTKGFTNLGNEIQQAYQYKNYEEHAFSILVNTLKKQEKKIILFIDNLNDLFKKFDEIEQRRLREILITCNDIRLVGASSRLWEALYEYDQPFMDFFKTIDLDALSNEDVIMQLHTLADIHGHKGIIEKIIKESPERINVLRILTGGVPRTIALLFQIFVDNEMNDSVKDLYAVVEAVTPLYKHRMDDFSTQHQKIVDAVAKFWDACSTAEIAEKTRMESKAVSAQLKVLVRDQVIEQVKTNNKNHLYRLRERFFNIWYLMRFGKQNDKDKVIWLTKFLDSWCDKDDLKKRLQNVVENMKSNKYDKSTSDFLLNALMQSEVLDVEDKVMVVSEPDSSFIFNHEFDVVELVNLLIKKIENHSSADDIHKILKCFKKNKENIYLTIPSIMIDSLNSVDTINNVIKKDAKLFNNATKYLTMNTILFLTSVYLYSNLYLKENSPFTVLLIELKTALISISDDSYKDLENHFRVLFQLLIAKHQYHIAYNLFHEEKLKLKTQLKPIYYALMHFMKDEYPNEYLKMGSELKEPVEQIIGKILKMRELYA